MAKFCELSEEMLEHFLSRLPPKALLRFKCVCKSWYNLISSPKFVAKNLSVSKNNKFASASSIFFKRPVLKDNTITDKKEIFDILRDGSTEKKGTLLSFVDLCNDTDRDNQNLPSVVDDFFVPLPRNYDDYNDGFEEDGDGDDDSLTTHAVGFGYDSKTRNYKVVRVVDSTGASSRAEVCTLGANSWREIDTNNIQSQVFWRITFNGNSYWSAYISEKKIILTFDMSDELFHEIPLPDIFHRERQWSISLAIMKESLVILTYEGEREISDSYDIWMMDNVAGVIGLWTKYLTFIPAEGPTYPLVFLKSDELLMTTTNGRVVFYNLSNQNQNCLPSHGVEDPPYILAVHYVNTLVSVKGDN